MTAQGAVSASSGIDHVDAGEKRPVKLAMSRQFLAAPAGNADGRELSNEEVRLGNYLDSWNVPDGDGSLEPSVRKMVRDGAGVPSAPIGQRPAWAFERVEELSSPEADNVCQRIPAPWELGGEEAVEEEIDTKFSNYQDTMMLRQSKPVPKRGLVSPGCDKEEASFVAGEDSGRRVKFQPRMRDGNAGGASEAPPTLQAGAVSVFTVGREPSDECGMFRGDAAAGAGTPGGFPIRQDTEVLNKRGDFEAREDTEVLRMGTGGGFDIREDTEVLRFGGNDVTAGAGVSNNDGFEIREDTEVLRPTTTLQTAASNIREDTEVLGNGVFGVREDTEVLNRTNNTGTGAFVIREDTDVLTRGNNTAGATSDAFAIREDTEVLGRRENHTHTGVFSIREDTQVLEDSVFSQQGPVNNTAGAGDFAIREDTDLLSRVLGNTTTGMFSVREDTEVLEGEFAVREDTEVLTNLHIGGVKDKKAGPSAQSGGLTEQQRSGSSGVLLGGERYDSERVLGPSVPQGSNDLAALRAPSGHLRPINKSGPLPLGDAGGLGVVASSPRSSQKLRETSARRKLQFGDVAEPLEASGNIGLLAPKGDVSCELEGGVAKGADLVSPLLAGASVELPEAEDFTVLEAEDAQGGGAGGHEAALLDAENSQGRESFLDDEDTENAAAIASSGAERLQAALAATSSRGISGASAQNARGAAARIPRSTGCEHDMLRTLDDCPEYLLQFGSEVDADSRPGSVHTSPIQHSGAAVFGGGGSSSLPGSPLQNRGAFGSGRKPPLSPGKHLQGHSRRAMQPPGASGVQAHSGRQFGDSTLQSAAATLNPFLPEFTSTNIAKISPLNNFSGVHEIPHATLRAFVDALAAGHEAKLPAAALEPGTAPLGSGGYATVYSATLSSSCIAGAAGERVALKVATPAAAWEFAAARVISDRVPARYASLFLPARCIFLSSGWDASSTAVEAGTSRDAAPKKRCALGTLSAGDSQRKTANAPQSLSVLAMPQGVDGTLLDLINAHKAAGQPIGDSLVLYIALQMLLILHAMQQARVIHTDLKPDNCLLSWPAAVSANAPPVAGRTPSWSAASASARGGHWGSGCLQAIDFGRAIDLQLMPVGTQFEGVSTTEGLQCPEMLSGKPWHYCHDAFCVAGTIHAVLLGKYIAVQQTQSLAQASGAAPAAGAHKPVYRPSTSVPSSNPRKPLWDRLFRTLLNCPLAPERPDVTPLLAEFTSALETAEASKPRLWHDMATARQLTAGFLSRRRAA